MNLPAEIWSQIYFYVWQSTKVKVLEDVLGKVDCCFDDHNYGRLKHEQLRWKRPKLRLSSDKAHNLLNCGHMYHAGRNFSAYTAAKFDEKQNTYFVLDNEEYHLTRLMHCEAYYFGNGIRPLYSGDFKKGTLKCLTRFSLYWFYEEDRLYIHEDFFQCCDIQDLADFFGVAIEQVGDTACFKGVGKENEHVLENLLAPRNLGAGGLPTVGL